MEENLSLAGFQGRHQGETVVVCGCGSSIRELEHPERLITIGVNDIGRLFDPTYLVVLNPRHHFTPERFRHVETSSCHALFTQLDLGLRHPQVVRFKLGQRGGTELSDPEVLPYTSNSPYVAVCLAAHMGASRVGIIGVDFTDDHFFSRTGPHTLSARLRRIDREYDRLAAALARRRIELVNLSQQSRLSSLPKVDCGIFCGSVETGQKSPCKASRPKAPSSSCGGRRRIVPSASIHSNG